MQLPIIFSSKKSSIAGRKVIFYIYAAVAVSITFLVLVWIIPANFSEIAVIPSGLENYLLIQRFFTSPLCFALQGEKTDRVDSWTIDLAKFNENSLNKCYDAQNTDVKAYRLTISYGGQIGTTTPSKIIRPVPDDKKDTCNNICGDKGCVSGVDDGVTNKECSASFGFEGYDDYCICATGSEKVIPVPTNFKSNCGVQCNQKSLKNKCIAGIDDGSNNEKCDQNFGFEENDDYCICGDIASEHYIPQPERTFKSSCSGLCREVKDKGCVMGIDDGNNKKKCRERFEFEGGESDDYCICGDTREVEGPLNTKRSCSDTCGHDACIIGVDDGKNYKKCSEPFAVEKANDDDYCLCGGIKEIPVPDDKKGTSCNNICSDKGKACLSAVNDNKAKKCDDDSFTFNNNDDYCFCGQSSEELIPVRDDFKSTCSNICNEARNTCINGVDDSYTYKKCDDKFGFEGTDDYCICGQDAVQASNEGRITIITKNWQGILEKAETFQIFVYDSGTMQKGELLIEVQGAK